MATKHEYRVSTPGVAGGRLVINNDGFIALDSTNDEQPSAEGQIAYVSGVGFRAYGETGAFTIGSGGGGTALGDLDGVYSNGQEVTIDEGPITLTDATTDALNTLELVKSGAGSGNVLDIGINAALTGNAIDVDMNTGVAAVALYIDDGAGARTGSDIQVKDDSTGTHSVINIDKSGAGASIGLDITSSYAGSPGGAFIKLTHGNGDSLDTPDLWVVRGTGVMANPVIDVDDASTGSGDIIDIDLTGVYTGDVFDFASAAAATGNVFFVNLDNAVAMTALHVEGSGVRTQPYIEISSDATGSADMIDIELTGIYTGNVIDIGLAAAVTGNVIDIDLNAGVAAKALYIDCGAAVRTAAAIDIKHDGSGNVSAINIDHTNTGSGNIIELDIDSVHTGDAININYGTGAATGDAIDISTGTNLAGNALKITTAGARTAPVINIVGGGTDAGTDDHIIFITQSGVLNSNMIQLTYDTGASDGDAIGIAMGTNVAGSALAISATGARTDDLIKIDSDQTNSGLIFDINISGTGSGNVLDVTYSAANTGDAIAVTMADNVAGSALVIDAAGTRTDDVVKMEITDAGAAMVFDINIDAAGSGNCLDITYATDAHTGNAIDINMGTNVAGQAIAIGTSATGVDGYGSAIDIVSDGVLVAGADLISIKNTGAISSTSNAVSIATIGDAGSFALYISATGSAEAIKVDNGTVTFDETLTVSGATTLSTVLYKDLTEVVAATNVITAAESGSVFFLNHATEFVSTLPALAAGLHFTFIVTGAPSGASYTIVTNGADNVIKGNVVCSADAAGDTEASGADTITFADGQAVAGDKVEAYCDGTNWFVYGTCAVAAGITITTAA